MTFNAKRFLLKPPANLAGWMRELPVEDLPVLARTGYELEDWREFEEQVDLQMLDDLVSADPLMTAKLFGFVAKRRGKDVPSEAENVREAVLLIGTSAFFRAFGANNAAEVLLADQGPALEEFQEVLERARRAARLSAAFASQRDDPDAGLLGSAAMLHHLPELIVWLKAPALAAELLRQRRAAPEGPHEEMERLVLNVSFDELRLELMKSWRLPARLARLATSHTNLDEQQVKNVRLALKASRHAGEDWEHPALGDLVREIGDFLQLGLQHTWGLLKKVEALDS